MSGRYGGPPVLVAPAVALLCLVATRWKGMPLSADGWAMWQGAVSLAAGNGYRYFSGHPIAAWPPLYPLYMALWTPLLGPTGLSLVLSQGLLLLVQAVLWAWLFQRIAAESALPMATGARLLVGGFLGLFLWQIQPTILAHNLVYALLPLLLWVLWRLVSRPGPRQEFAWLASGILVSCLMLLAHNAAVVFVAAAAAVVALRPPLSRRSIAGAGLLFVIPCLVWTLARQALGQTGSHAIGWGAGHFGAASYIGQMVSGVGELLLPPRSDLRVTALPLLLVAAFGLCWRARRTPTARALALGLGFVLPAAFFTLVLFNLTFVRNPLSGARFIGFLPLILLPLVFLTADARWPRSARAVLLILIAVQAYWVAVTARSLWTRSLPELGFGQDWEATRFVPLDARIDPGFRARPPVASDRGFLVAPPSFEETPGRR